MDSSNLDSDESDAVSFCQSLPNDKKRQAHILSEQRRRDSIKKGYQEIIDLLNSANEFDIKCSQVLIMPKFENNFTNQKISKALVLQKIYNYIHHLQDCAKLQDDEMLKLKKELEALQIMKLNYQNMLNNAKNKNDSFEHNYLTNQQIIEYNQNKEIKNQIFYMILDFLFLTFNTNVLFTNYKEFSRSLLQWLEDYCKPSNLKDITLRILSQINPKNLIKS